VNVGILLYVGNWDLGEVGNYQIEISKGFLLNDLWYHLFFCFEELQFKELI
jgi:hypothetical protein